MELCGGAVCGGCVGSCVGGLCGGAAWGAVWGDCVGVGGNCMGKLWGGGCVGLCQGGVWGELGEAVQGSYCLERAVWVGGSVELCGGVVCGGCVWELCEGVCAGEPCGGNCVDGWGGAVSPDGPGIYTHHCLQYSQHKGDYPLPSHQLPPLQPLPLSLPTAAAR